MILKKKNLVHCKFEGVILIKRFKDQDSSKFTGGLDNSNMILSDLFNNYINIKVDFKSRDGF